MPFLTIVLIFTPCKEGVEIPTALPGTPATPTWARLGVNSMQVFHFSYYKCLPTSFQVFRVLGTSRLYLLISFAHLSVSQGALNGSDEEGSVLSQVCAVT